uniref:SFRICE_013986 n=1 Tax=Spodoptera frugiperda TaxID=7108 RepID=A0A2H1WGN2_SPOFR
MNGSTRLELYHGLIENRRYQRPNFSLPIFLIPDSPKILKFLNPKRPYNIIPRIGEIIRNTEENNALLAYLLGSQK